MTNKTITQEQINIIKDAAKALKDYNELTGMGLGFSVSGQPSLFDGIFEMFKPAIPPGADGPYPSGLKAEMNLNNLIKELESN
jgi:hypothetical protein